MNRRDFLAASAAAAALPLSPAHAEDKPVLPIVDTHQHLWDLEKLKLAWFDPKTPEGKILGHSFTPKEYAEATKGVGVVKAVYMEVDVVPEQQQAEADYIVELCESKKSVTCAAVVSGRPNSDWFEKYAKQFKGHKYVKGIRQVLHVKDAPAGYALEDKFVKGIKLLGDLGLSFDLCVRPAELPDFGKLIDRCPNTRFILDHCGNANLKHTPAEREQWKKDMAEIAKKKNLVCKVSGFIASAPARGKWTVDDLAPVVNHTLDVFGPDRVMFGGDWPVCLLGVEKYADWPTALKTIVKDRPEEQQKKLFHDNAVKFYGLDS
ncbi:amidohydrolase : Putative TIM-barrel fold metal-dependent hydrolase OS=Singulisphaera acidiphila (strain ATCC BAA-1392 / DSM 18658 / VKM B-2454 / MOB10) GN=Sinac_0439 PE=4 SV=1: Amidohydro_2 [Gemmataceae bacterium]|nr:amidohydrolase : Putative TIM-barrel fold metal-dependent hydrolase OS=Singulisphaera acidiphila (strain ATCC BAA-1392 / DSM 18658 / VKM B-2454 / MOB10) GN=Sinac_0439 PE=4 SV=1: Amidohydro_2 [Gemmataceae bacterium]VTT98664.1 amidohydrolase : Putative TIM-barrel fold metal-dependent hydrolase OS=Singulisphaera acidiphila (strain ATCC BAA-1392 / DSM 18658 / VKM B-2454 / MOB10) GN=Sinac_0439 PE=4 SV=1: Amidohydro_2 [Gemmataceae bacterium]